MNANLRDNKIPGVTVEFDIDSVGCVSIETMARREKAEASRNGHKQSSNGVKKNGHSSPVKTKSEPTKEASARETSESSTMKSATSLALCGLVALLSFIAGLWTPPFLVEKNVSQVQRPVVSAAHNSCDEEALSHFLHDSEVAGMHVVCLEKSSGGLKIKVFAGAQNRSPIEVTSNSSWLGVRDSVQSVLHLRQEDELHQPWAIFSHIGERIADEHSSGVNQEVVDDLLTSGLVLLFEGGQWMWPGVRIGYKRTVDLYSIMPGAEPTIKLPGKTTTTLETLSLKPLVLSVENFLSEKECDRVQEASLETMRVSSVSFTDYDRGKNASDFRTSSNTFIDADDDILKDLDYRTASLVRVPRIHQEQVQVLRYGKTQHYVAHHDYFKKEYYTQDKSTLRLIQNGRRNRMATVFWYLSDVEAGGHTVFPQFNGAPQPSDFKDCSIGLKVKPERGKVIIFYSQTADGELDQYSLHGACPVEKGIKWAANKWVWNLPMPYIGEDD